MHTEWRHATPTSRHSFDLHICIGSSEMGKQGVIFVPLSWLIQLSERTLDLLLDVLLLRSSDE